MPQPKARNAADMELRRHVLEELDFEPAINAANVGVSVQTGVVTLSGHVESYVEKLTAEKAAKRIKGVKAIANEIKVRFAGDKKTADDQIAQRAVSILHWSAVAPGGAIMVKVQDGWVGLSGEVDWNYQRTAVEALLHRLSGVKGIINSIKVRPHADPITVKSRIEAALRRNALVRVPDICVSVEDDGRVILEGLVHDWQERNAIEDAAWSAPGVTWVDDRMSFG
jgi:osmotically-inducible protein OsmY